MKKILLLSILSVVILLMTVSGAAAAGFEAAVGYWWQLPDGTVQYQGDPLDVRNDLGYKREGRLMGRVKIYLPGALPNFYFMATPMRFGATSETSAPFTFANEAFAGGSPFNSHTKLDHYDAAIFYSVFKSPVVRVLNIDLGIDARLINFKATIDQPSTGTTVTVSKSIIIPMAYAAVRIKPAPLISFEGEGRGILLSGEHYYDLIGRLKLAPIPFTFVAGGWRFEGVKINRNDLFVKTRFNGPFTEAGVEF